MPAVARTRVGGPRRRGRRRSVADADSHHGGGPRQYRLPVRGLRLPPWTSGWMRLAPGKQAGEIRWPLLQRTPTQPSAENPSERSHRGGRPVDQGHPSAAAVLRPGALQSPEDTGVRVGSRAGSGLLVRRSSRGASPCRARTRSLCLPGLCRSSRIVLRWNRRGGARALVVPLPQPSRVGW